MPEYYTAEDFSKVLKYDAHMHYNLADRSFLQQAAADNFRLLTINVSPHYYPAIEEQLSIAAQLHGEAPDRISFVTTFSMDGWDTPGWQQRAIAYLQKSFALGAIGVKVWKNIGMEIRDSSGRFVMIDDPRFDSIFSFMAAKGIPLLGHLGEPRNCWLPVAEMTVNGDKEYFAGHPEYHMHLHPEYPSYEDQIDARDRLLERHPGLRFIGAHLGSLEWSVEELAKRLDKYPNMAVDTAQRISHLQYQAVNNWQQVHDFLVNYQDRLLYGTDTEVDHAKTAAQRNKDAHENWLHHWQFFTCGGQMTAAKVERPFNGMNLPRPVVDKIYRTNAERWYPGLLTMR